MGGFRMRLVETKLDEKGYNDLMDHIDSLEQAARFGQKSKENIQKLLEKLSEGNIWVDPKCFTTDLSLDIRFTVVSDPISGNKDMITVAPSTYDQ